MRLIALFVVLGVVTCSSQSRSEEEPLCDQHGSKRVDIPNADATISGFTIGRTSLEDVQAKLGKARIVRVSREEESDVQICYVSPADGTVFAVYSGAMGGWKDITRFALWSREAAFPDVSSCTASSDISNALATQSGLRLGLSAPVLKRIAGAPSRVSGSSMMKYDYACRRKMTEVDVKQFKSVNNWDVTSDPYFDRMSWIHVYFSKATVSHFEIGRIESY